MALTACVLGMFVITLDAVVGNVALPSISRELGGGVTGLVEPLGRPPGMRSAGHPSRRPGV